MSPKEALVIGPNKGTIVPFGSFLAAKREGLSLNMTAKEGGTTMLNSHEIKMRKLAIELKQLSQEIDLLIRSWDMAPDTPEKPSFKAVRAASAKRVKKGSVREHK